MEGSEGLIMTFSEFIHLSTMLEPFARNNAELYVESPDGKDDFFVDGIHVEDGKVFIETSQ